MESEAWQDGSKAIGMYLNGHGIAGKDTRGGTITDDHFLLYFNADGPATVTLPPEEYAAAWDVVINTGGNADSSTTCAAGSTFEIETRSLLVLREHVEPELEVDHSVAASVALASGTTERRAPRKEKR
jgi:glycogen operon protein